MLEMIPFYNCPVEMSIQELLQVYLIIISFKSLFLSIDDTSDFCLEKGRVFMFGSNNWGQLGLGHENNVDRPSCIKCE